MAVLNASKPPIQNNRDQYVEPPVKSVAEPLKTSIVETQFTPRSALLTHLSGSRWIVDYYSQVIGTNEELKAFDPNQQTIYQSYRRINRCEILLQGGLNTSIDPVSNEARISGSAVLYPGLIPNQYDVIIGDIGDGRLGQFTITEPPQRKSYFNDSAYEINFTMSRYYDKRIEDMLEQRLVKNLFFQRDYLTYGQNPYLIEEDFHYHNNLEKYIASIEDRWVKEFYNKSKKVFLVPGQVDIVYDPYIVSAVMALFTQNNNNLYRQVNVLNVDDWGLNYIDSLWSLLLSRDEFKIHSVFKEAELLSSTQFTSLSQLNSIRYSGVESVVVPKDLDMGYGAGEYGNGGISGSFSCGCNGKRASTSTINDSAPTEYDGTIGTLLPVVNKDGYYVLSKAFYEKDFPNMVKFEKLLWDGILKSKVDPSEVFTYFEAYPKWSKIDRFYLGIVLVILMRYSLRSI